MRFLLKRKSMFIIFRSNKNLPHVNDKKCLIDVYKKESNIKNAAKSLLNIT